MSPHRYLLDTNIFITAKIRLPFDIYPSFWSALSRLANNGFIHSIKRVEEEILKGNDDLAEWVVKNLDKGFFISEDDKTLIALSTVSQWSQTNTSYTPSAKNEFVNVADSWLVAEALSQNFTVITYETPDPNCKRRVKIPDACKAVGVKYCSLNDAFRTLGIKI